MADVQLSAGGDFSALNREFDKLHKEVGKLKEAMAGASQQGKAGAEQHAGGLSKVTRELSSVAAGYLSVATAINLVTTAHQEEQQFQRTAAQAQMSEAETQKLFLLNYQDMARTAEGRDAAIAKIQELSNRTDMKTRDLYEVAADLASAKGNLPDETMWKMLEGAARTYPGAPDKAKLIGRGALEIAKAYDIKDWQTAIGAMMRLQSLSDVSDPAKVAEHAVPALKALAAAGATLPEGVAFVAYLSQLRADFKGRKSATMAISMGAGITDWFPKADEPVYEIGPGGRPRQVGMRKGVGQMTFTEKWDRLQKDEREGRAFLQKAAFGDEAGRLFATEFLGYGLPAAGEAKVDRGKGIAGFKEFMAKVGPVDEMGAKFENLLSVIEGATAQKAARFDRGLTQQVESARLANKAGMLRGMEREKVSELLGQAGEPWYMRWTRPAVNFLGYLGGETEAEAMQRDLADIRFRRRQAAGGGGWGGLTDALLAPMLGWEAPERIASPEQKEMVEILKRSEARLDSQLEELRLLNRKQRTAGAGATNQHNE